MKRKYKVINWSMVFAVLFVMQSCSDDGVYHIPDPKTGLQNDLVKRSIGPNVVGGSIDFAYAMAILKKEGNIIESTVEPLSKEPLEPFLEINRITQVTMG